MGQMSKPYLASWEVFLHTKLLSCKNTSQISTTWCICHLRSYKNEGKAEYPGESWPSRVYYSYRCSGGLFQGSFPNWRFEGKILSLLDTNKKYVFLIFLPYFQLTFIITSSCSSRSSRRAQEMLCLHTN